MVKARYGFASLTLGVAVLTLAACGQKKPPAPPPAGVIVAHPLQKSIVDWDDYVGQFVAVDSVDVRPRVTGYLQSVAFKDGASVRKGQLLFVIDPRPYQALVDQAKAQVARQEATVANTKAQQARGSTLLAGHAMSQQDYDTLVAAAKQAQADLAAAQATLRTNLLNLGFTHVTAPMSGRVSDRKVAPGNLVTQDSTLLTNIVNLDPIRFAFTGSEGSYLKYQRENQAGTRTSSRFSANPVQIKLQDENSYRWHGRMEFVDNAIDTNSGTIRGRAVVANPNMFLTPGMFGHLRLLGSGRYPGLLIPDEAVQTDQNRQVVYVVDGKNIAHPKTITVGPLIQGLRVVRSGLDANDLVVIGGVQKAHAGKPVTPKQGKIEAQPGQPDEGGYIEAPGSSAALADSK
ncbi:MAG: efflux RND transporter periplasmic adaptor subunit [Pseudomonadota bacterium]|nr:efflux RND transporter periplasmic adaptor subunit [Pseudomonadota bacterium]